MTSDPLSIPTAIRGEILRDVMSSGQRLVGVHLFMKVGGALVKSAFAVEQIKDGIFLGGISRVVVAGRKPNAQISSVVECCADDRKHIQVAGHGGLAGLFLRQNTDGE